MKLHICFSCPAFSKPLSMVKRFLSHGFWEGTNLPPSHWSQIGHASARLWLKSWLNETQGKRGSFSLVAIAIGAVISSPELVEKGDSSHFPWLLSLRIGFQAFLKTLRNTLKIFSLIIKILDWYINSCFKYYHTPTDTHTQDMDNSTDNS